MIAAAIRKHLFLRAIVTSVALTICVVAGFFLYEAHLSADLRLVFLALCIWVPASGVLALRGPSTFFWLILREQHPWLKPLHEFGDPLATMESIDSELATSRSEVWGEPFRFDWRGRLKPAVIVSSNWIVHIGKAGLIIVPFRDIVAVHREVRRGRISWRRNGEFHSVRMIAAHRDPYILDFPTQEAIIWLGQRIVESRPEILYGDTEEYRLVEREGRYAMLDAVQTRALHYASMAPDEQKEWRIEALDEYKWCIDAHFF